MERYVLRGGRWGYDRLQLLARVRRPYTLELLSLAGLRSGMRCVDLGCGGGEGTFELAEMTGPGGFVTGVDMDEVAAAIADLGAFAADPQTLFSGPRVFQLWARRS
jgi:ubiquinone/menaquinone biosynthesis C-methylase UbiE